MDTTSLRQGYAELIAEARRGGFGQPPAGEWSAEQIIAHVAANDELLAETTEHVLSGNRRAYYNHDAVDTAKLTEIVAAHGNLEALTDWLEKTSSRLVELAGRLDEKMPTMVHTTIRDGDLTRVDQPWPWPRAIKVQAGHHLPAHLAQLRALRV
ncbi:hypothetical protein Rhe02_48590 [Rhizocola hellebori]|uniref:DinB family protein n=1 Tax=Rhizocola hellebori TaxID=1392758 RepID=A0A8J3VHZ9_9ACTN|nr:hypothetical protein [Rhizocola hellebori]GIH06792.1 hypothetical protein Rhe02_48590 [Rhizocola hellebori]